MMKTVDFKLTYMGDCIFINRRSWERIEKFLKTHGMKVTTKERRTPLALQSPAGEGKP